MRLLKALNQQVANKKVFSFPKMEDYKQEITLLLTSAAKMTDAKEQFQVASFPSTETFMRRIDCILNTLPNTEEQQEIKIIYKRLTKESVGLYYVIQKAYLSK